MSCKKLWRFAILTPLLGCMTAKDFSAETIATYTAPNGAKIDYRSTKEQQNLSFHYDATTGTVNVSVQSARTQDSVVEATMRNQIMQNEIIRDLISKAMNVRPMP